MIRLKFCYYSVLYKIRQWDWYIIIYTITSISSSILIYLNLDKNRNNIDLGNSLELILTINGLFSAILVTYFFNRISFTLESKKELYNEAVVFSQKINEFRRILQKLTQYYNVWKSDDATKSLLEHNKYKNIDYYDFKYMSFSDFIPNDFILIDELKNDSRFEEGQSELFLGMISLVHDRKNDRIRIHDELYKDFQKKGIYRFEFIQKCIDIGYLGRLGYWFDKDYNYIRYQNLGVESREYILAAAARIDEKYKKYSLDNSLMAELCDDMNEHYFKELYDMLLNLRKGFSNFNLLIFMILFLTLLFGVLFPFFIYFVITSFNLKKILTDFTIAINFGLLLFFILSLYRLVKKEITWA